MDIANTIVNTIIALTALSAAITTITIYQSNKKDKWQEGATILLSEIRQVINLLMIVRADFNKNGFLVERRYLLEETSWDKYKYIILPKITFEQWNSLKSFFEAVKLYDKAITINDGYFEKNANQIWISLHRHYLKVLEKNLDVKLDEKVAKLKDVYAKELPMFRDFYISNTERYVGYSPILPINMAKEALESIDENILTSSTGEELIKLAGQKT